ncbi:MAG: hypothetical protein ACXW18_03470, partial [Pyrinomonadaceae bacterium]
GKKMITLRNNSDGPMKVSLSGVITSGGKPSSAKLLFAQEGSANPSEVVDFELKAQTTVKLWAIVTDLWEPGDFDAELRNKNTPTGDKLRIKGPSFNIKLDGPDPDKADVSLIRGEVATINIKNEDAQAYALTWRLRIDGRDVCGGNLTIDQKSIALLECTPSATFSASRISDLFKSDKTEGNQLLLYPKLSGNTSGVSPWKSFPVKANLNYFGLFTQQIVSYLVIVLALILGGLTSLFLSQALPNRLKRLNIQDQLDTMARTISDFSSNIDSKLQVLTRVERSRLRELLKSRNTFSPDFSSIATEVGARIGKLSMRVAMVQQMDLALGRLSEAIRHDAAPSRIDEIEACIDRAKGLLTKSQPTDEEFKAAQEAITDASNRVEGLNKPDADFGQRLAQRAQEVKTSIAAIETTATFKRIDGKVPGPYQVLKKIPANTTTIPFASYSSVDLATEKMILVRDYVELAEGLADPAAKERLAQREGRFLDFLQPNSRIALESARLLVREMKDDVYPERLQQALHATPQEVSIDTDPSYAYESAALTLCVCFHSAAVNSAAAREEWSCFWEFGDGLRETGWNVSHYFQLPKPETFKRKASKTFDVKATFQDAEGKEVVDANFKPVVISAPVAVQPSILGNLGERSWTEGLKLSAALLIAVFGLVAGARTELLKLDILPGLIAVFLVGFGADTIKNLLTTKS